MEEAEEVLQQISPAQRKWLQSPRQPQMEEQEQQQEKRKQQQQRHWLAKQEVARLLTICVQESECAHVLQIGLGAP